MALIELSGVCRVYDGGANPVHALRDVDLLIEAGEMVAIMGASGSGKSTLMNLLGCLDQSTAGEYRVAGCATHSLDADALAALRRERFGFVFQRYHLLPHQSALANVLMPAIYAGRPAAERLRRASEMLTRLGLTGREAHRPNALSGGQQQRVSIARALMNGGEIILADEPTGALDSATGAEMMALLKALHGCGHTVILVTHDAQVAAYAPRVVELSDGRIVRDTGWPADADRARFEAALPPERGGWAELRHQAAQLGDAVRMAFESLWGHRLRSALSMLGIGVGIAAVVSIVALGDAAQAAVDGKLRGLLSGKLMIMRGNLAQGPGAQPLPFRRQDIAAISAMPGVKSVVPEREMTITLRHGDRSGDMTLIGSIPGALAHQGVKLAEGRDLSEIDLDRRTQVVVINQKARDRLFAPGAVAIGQTVMVGPQPCIVIGLTTQGGGAIDVNGGWRDIAFVPTTTFDEKVNGSTEVARIDVYMTGERTAQEVRAGAAAVLKVLHGSEDFRFFSLDTELRQIREVAQIVKIVLAAIAGISLLVGGIGIMNMMLVAVSERMPEIGIRMAVGARSRDIQTQFLVEAVVLCLIGGAAGVALPWLVAIVANVVQHDLTVVVTWSALALAVGVASAIGIGFGFVPARQASHLSPLQALSRE